MSDLVLAALTLAALILVLALVTASVPIAIVVLIWGLVRYRFVREATTAQRFIDSSADLDLFALRAMAGQPMTVLARIGPAAGFVRGALQDTVIEDGVKLDNLVQIGHNVRVGRHSAMAGCVGVAGSATIGAHCTLGGGAIVLGHLALADDVHVSAATVVTHSLKRPGHYTGMFPIDENARWEKNAATLKQLHRLRDRIKALEQAFEAA